MRDAEARADVPRSQYLMYAVAGAVDVAASPLVTMLRRAQALFGRSDLAQLAGNGGEELAARGKLAVQRSSHVPEAHLESLARQVAAMRPPSAGDETGRQDG
jgi:hypothetical protein